MRRLMPAGATLAALTALLVLGGYACGPSGAIGGAPIGPDNGSTGGDAGTRRLRADAGSKDFSALCRACTSNNQCGGGGNLCASDSAGSGVCGIACGGSAGGCPRGYACYAVTDATGSTAGDVCLPENDAPCPRNRPPPAQADAGVGSDAGVTSLPPPPSADAGVTSSLPPSPFPACTTDTWTHGVSGWFGANCVTCHAPYTDFTQVEAIGGQIRNDIATGRMPTNAHLPPGDVTRIDRWIDCDMPE